MFSHKGHRKNHFKKITPILMIDIFKLKAKCEKKKLLKTYI